MMAEYYEYCEHCDTLRDEDWNTDLFPRELIDVRGDVKWRHTHYRDRMFSTTCKNQLAPEPAPPPAAISCSDATAVEAARKD